MKSNDEVNLPEEQERHHRSKHGNHSGRRKLRRSPVRKALRWIKKNPNKTIALILAVVIIYVTYLFIMYSLEHPKRRNITSVVSSKRNNATKGDVKVLVILPFSDLSTQI